MKFDQQQDHSLTTDEGAIIMIAKKKKAKKAAKPKEAKPKPMSTKQYLATLDQLGLTVAGKATAKALGMGVRHCQRIAAGDVSVPGPVEILLKLYLKHGIEDDS